MTSNSENNSANNLSSSHSLKKMKNQLLNLLETKLWAKILVGMFCGLVLGVLLGPEGFLFQKFGWSKEQLENLGTWFALPGRFFIRVIQMVITPLIFASIVRGISTSFDIKRMKVVGLGFFLFVIINTLMGSGIGILVTTLLSPGKNLNLTGLAVTSTAAGDGQKFLGPDHLLQLFPANPLQALVEGQMLDVVVLSFIFGIAVLALRKDQIDKTNSLLEVVQEVSMTIITWSMKIAPYAVFGMLFQVTVSTGIHAMYSMAQYIVSTFIAFVLMFCIYLLLLFLVKRENPFKFLSKISEPLLIAFSTSSSAATMPVTMNTAIKDLHSNEGIARFLIPLGATINMAGTAIWQTAAVVFISQAYSAVLSTGQLMLIIATSVGSSIGTPGVPGVGIGILTTLLLKIGIPIEGVSLILGVDRIIDMGCTVVNVGGDLVAVKIFDSSNDATS